VCNCRLIKLVADLSCPGVVLQMMGAEGDVEACDEGNDEECMQRRLLRGAHLDYIYTQDKGN
jgi:hypothetical protein